MATLLGCDDIIDYDQYEDAVPRVIKPFKGNIPDSLMEREHLLRGTFTANRMSYYETLKKMGLGQPSNQPFEHYEAPKVKKEEE